MPRKTILGIATLALLATTAPLAQAVDPDRSAGSRVTATRHVFRAAPGFQAMADSSATFTGYVNQARARVGLNSLPGRAADRDAMTKHLNYVLRNPDADPYTEEPGRPGYTPAGARIAEYVVLSSNASWAQLRDYWGSLPAVRDGLMLEPSAVTLEVAQVQNLKAWLVGFGESPFGAPIVYPKGANATERTFTAGVEDPSVRSDYGCSGYTGYPISGHWDWNVYDVPTRVTGTLYADGVRVSACTAKIDSLDYGQAVLIPQAPLKAGAHYTGTITATMPKAFGGTSETRSQSVDFSTSAAASGRPGDESGDGVADALAISSTGKLWLSKAASTGTLTHGWSVASGWGSYNWAARVPDTNGDQRADLLVRAKTGEVYLLRSAGMGQFSSRVQVARGLQKVSMLSVVGDMDANGSTDLVGRGADGALYRWSLKGTTLGQAVKLATSAKFTRILAAGSLDADKRPDVLVVKTDGTLWRYSSTSTGRLGKVAKVGSGWSSFTGVAVPGDITKDGRPDLLVRRADGTVHTYRNTGTGFAYLRRAGAGWNQFAVMA